MAAGGVCLAILLGVGVRGVVCGARDVICGERGVKCLELQTCQLGLCFAHVVTIH